MDKSKGFRCDEHTKVEYSNFIKAKFRGWNLVIQTPYDERSPFDMYLTAYTDYTAYTYAFELKERDWRYPSDKYGTQGNRGGWILEDHKIENFHKAEAAGYQVIYVNLYPDNVIRNWNITKAPEGALEHRGGVRTYNLHTVDDEGGKYNKAKVEIFNDWAKDYDRETYERLN